MAETKSRFLNRILDNETIPQTEEKAYSAERQHTAQAFNLHVKRRDRRHSVGFAWSHYLGYKWTDEGEFERLVVVFGTRAVEIQGQNLAPVVAKIQEGQLNGIREMETAKAALRRANAENEPIITSVRSYPDFEDVLKQIKGEEEHDAGFVGKTRGR